MSLEVGMKNKIERIVGREQLASSIGSGGLDVYATPSMILMMEEVCFNCVQAEVGEGNSTVGTRLNVSHDSPTPLGAKVFCECELIEVDKRRLTFNVTAYDESGVIGKGTHERFIVGVDKFMNKVNEKVK